MTDRAIGVLPALPEVTGDELIEVVRNGQSFKMTASQLRSLADGIPAGGSTGEVLTKGSGTDYDADWAIIPLPKHALVAGGAAGNITVTGIKVGDRLDSVIEYVYAGGGVAPLQGVVDLTTEFSIPPAPTGTISAFSDNLAGGTTVAIDAGTDPAAGAVTISGTTHYDGAHTASNIVAGVSFDINVVFTSDDATGNYLGVIVNNRINNTGGTATTDNKLLVNWTKLTA